MAELVKSWVVLTFDGKAFDRADIISASFHDKAGTKSDQINIQLMPNVPRPSKGAKVTLSFFNGLGEVLDCGVFFVQSVTRSNNKALSFTATGIEFNEKQKKKRNEHYKKTKLSSIVKIVGKRLGHEVKFLADDLKVESVYQTDETDIGFLDRLAEKYDVLFSIKNDKVFFISKNDESLPLYVVNTSKCESISVKQSSKTLYKSCEVTYYDSKKGKRIKVVVDDGTPVLEVKCKCKDETDAKLQGKAKLAKSQRGTINGNLTTIGQQLYAGTRLELANTYNNEDDGIYAIETATHTLSRNSLWTVDVEFENFKIKETKK